jgi:hypothetical protein
LSHLKGSISVPAFPRPIQTLVWYPAKRTSAAPMLVADYQQASLADVDFALSSAEAAKQRAAWMAGPMKSQYGASTLAVRGAPLLADTGLSRPAASDP